MSTPTTALEIGLKVDADVSPEGILKKVDLKDPATTVALLKMNAVDASNRVTRLGVTCALCHSTVYDSVMPGVGKRLDGWPNLSLDVGKVISLSPALNQDGKSNPLFIPPAYGLANVIDVKQSLDLVTAKLPALRAYQDSLTVRTSAISAVP